MISQSIIKSSDQVHLALTILPSCHLTSRWALQRPSTYSVGVFSGSASSWGTHLQKVVCFCVVRVSVDLPVFTTLQQIGFQNVQQLKTSHSLTPVDSCSSRRYLRTLGPTTRVAHCSGPFFSVAACSMLALVAATRKMQTEVSLWSNCTFCYLIIIIMTNYYFDQRHSASDQKSRLQARTLIKQF